MGVSRGGQMKQSKQLRQTRDLFSEKQSWSINDG